MKMVAAFSLLFVYSLSLIGCSTAPPPAKASAGKNGLSVRATAPVASNYTFDPAKYAALVPKHFSWGGLMYSKWWSDSQGNLQDAALPKRDNASWIATGNTATKGMQTWRCKSCHGWDYIGNEGQYIDPTHKYYTNIPGLLTTATYTPKTKGDPAAVFAVLDTGTMPDGTVIPDHDFGTHITKDEPIYALTKFVEQVRSEADGSLAGSNVAASPTTIVANIDAVANQAEGYRFYNLSTCVVCHGVDGKQIVINPDPGKEKEPHDITGALKAVGVEEFHKLRFGQPGTNPVMLGLEMIGNPQIEARGSLVVAADIFAYVRDGLLADPARGGRLYDDWPKELGTQAPLGANPVLKARNPNPGDIAADKQWLCSSCHGYDYEGISGFSNNLVDLQAVRHWTPDYLYSYLKNGRPAMLAGKLVPNVHNFGQSFNDVDLWNLSKFLMVGVTDTHNYISLGFGGAAVKKTPYDGPATYMGDIPDLLSTPNTVWTCQGCHGENGNGTGSSVEVAMAPTTDIFAASWSDAEAPWRVFHRIRFGMPGLYDLDGSGVEDQRMPGLTELVIGDPLVSTPVPFAPAKALAMLNDRSINVVGHLQDKLIATAPASVTAKVASVKQQVIAKSAKK